MPVLKGPLFSMGASGTLGKVLTYGSWKGLQVVRRHVVPSNPNTTLQQTQRSYMTAAVAMVHTAQARASNAMTSADQVAYSALAATLGRVMTWFNIACKLWCDVAVAAKTSVIYSDGKLTDATVNSIDIQVSFNEETGSDLAAGKFYFGTSKTNLIHSATADIVAGNSATLTDEDLTAFLTAGIKYFWQFRPDSGDPCEGADSGIYNFLAE